MSLLISQPISNFSQQNFNHTHLLHIHIHQAFHFCCTNIWTYTTKGTVQVGTSPVEPDALCPSEL